MPDVSSGLGGWLSGLRKNKLLSHLSANMMNGFAYHKIIFDRDGKPVDYVFLEVNEAFERLTGLKRQQILGKRVTEVLIGIEKDPADWIGVYGKVALTGEPVKFENYSKGLDKWFVVSAFSLKKGYFVATFEEITQRKKAEQALRESQIDLNRAQAVAKTGSWRLDMHRNVLLWSHETYMMFGVQLGTPLTYEIFLSTVHPDDREYVDQKWQAALRGEPYDIEHRIVVNGEIKWVRENAELDFSKEGLLLGGFGAVQDITERKKAEEEITRLASFPELNPSPVMEVNGECNICYSNPAAKSMFPDLEKSGRNHPFLSNCENIVKAIQNKEKHAFTREVKVEDECFYQYFYLVPKTKHVRIYAVNIDQMKRAENALRESEQRWATTMSSIGDAVIATDVDGRITFMNGVAEELTGWTLSETLQKPVKKVFNIINGQSRKEVEDPVAKVLKEGLIVGLANHTVLVRKDGTEVSIDDSGAPIKDKEGKITGVVLVFRDITERKKIEGALRKSEERYRSYIEVTGALGWTTNAGGEVVEDIPSFRNFTGQTFEDVKSSGWTKVLHPGDFGNTTRVWREAIQTKNKYEVEYRLRRYDGVYRYFMARGVPVFDDDGNVREWVGTCIDITERKELEKELFDSLEACQSRQSEVSALLRASKAVLQHREFKEAARLIFDSFKELLSATAGYVALLSKNEEENEVLFLDSGGLPCTVDPSLPMPIRGLRAEAYSLGKVVYCNDFLQSKWAKLMPKGHVLLRNALFAPLIIDKKTVGVIGIANKPGGFNEHDANIAVAFGEIASVALMNSRVLEKLEELVEKRTKELKDSERLAAIGETAGMVGHDLRNPLQTISGETYLAKTELKQLRDSPAKSSLEESIQIIMDQSSYMDKIVSDLQDYVRPIKPDKAPVNLRKLLNATLAEVTIPENIKVQKRINMDLPEVAADAQLLKRVFINLAINAMQAMPDGGTLTIKTQEKKQIKGNGKILIHFEDTGIGIPEEIKPKLFKPLFTTKSRGQGFGLAVCKRIVEAHGGAITFDSQESKGTQFTVELPVSNPNAIQR